MTIGLGPLQPFVDDERVTEVLVNGAGPVWFERDGVLQASDVTIDHDTIDTLIERLLGPAGRRVDRRTPFADARLTDGSRVNVVIPPVALDGPCISIRCFRRAVRALDALVPPDVHDLLVSAVHDGRNIVISGGAGAGKTTLLNALAAHIPDAQRVITIEDAAELNLPAAHVVRLEARPANNEGAGEITLRMLVRNALRMRPDRIVVGEVRGAEVLDMLAAMNTGNDGSLSTCHANSPVDAIRRLETMALLTGAALSPRALREQLVAAVDLVVHVERDGRGVRRVATVAEPAREAPLRMHDIVAGGRVIDPPRRPPRRAERIGRDTA